MTNVPLNQVVRLTAWNASQGTGPGESYGTCLTAMDSGATAKLMRVADANFLLTTPPQIRFFLPEDQLFILAPASNGGFRIVKFGTDKCLDAGDWFFNPDGSRTGVRHLVLKLLDAASPSQVFIAEKAEGFSQVDACKLLCTLEDGNRYELTPNDHPAKDFVLVTLGKAGGTPSNNLFAVQPQQAIPSPIDTGPPSPKMEPSSLITLKVSNRLPSSVSFEARWRGGATPPVVLKSLESGTIILDGVTPPRGTSCRVAARSGRKVIESDPFTVGPAVNSPFMEYILMEFVNSRGRKDIGFETRFNG